jgi:branched-chain amino acid transport system substrate-binding protein
LAVREINDAGGVDGQRIELPGRDDRLDADTGVAAARELVALGPVAILGVFSSRVALPVAQQVTIAAGMPVITSGSSPLLSSLDDHDTVWRTVASDVRQGAALADEMLAQGGTRIAVIHVDDAFGVGASEAVRLRLVARGVTPLANISYPSGKTIGFDAELTALAAGGPPRAVLIVGFALDAASIARGLKERFGAAMARLFAAGNLGAAFVRAVGLGPEGTSFTGHAALHLVAMALAQAGGNSRAAVLQNLRAVSRPDSAQPVAIHPGQFALALTAARQGADLDYQGVGGRIGFDAAGDPTSGTYPIQQALRAPDASVAFVERKTIALP